MIAYVRRPIIGPAAGGLRGNQALPISILDKGIYTGLNENFDPQLPQKHLNPQ